MTPQVAPPDRSRESQVRLRCNSGCRQDACVRIRWPALKAPHKLRNLTGGARVEYLAENPQSGAFFMKRLLAVIPILALSACVYTQDSHTRDKGTEVSQNQVAKVEPGKTTKEWILTNLGTPDRIHSEKDGLEVYEYVSERTQRSESKFFLLFSIESDKTVSKKITRVVMKSGVVESVSTTDG
jgi:outer membrane protein assembly factor BamE (lipoprotein component of BamABCDE complex)